MKLKDICQFELGRKGFTKYFIGLAAMCAGLGLLVDGTIDIGEVKGISAATKIGSKHLVNSYGSEKACEIMGVLAGHKLRKDA